MSVSVANFFVTQVLLNGSKQMEITGCNIETVGRVVHNAKLKCHNQSQVLLAVWGLAFSCKVMMSWCSNPSLLQQMATVTSPKCTTAMSSSYSVMVVHKKHTFVVPKGSCHDLTEFCCCGRWWVFPYDGCFMVLGVVWLTCVLFPVIIHCRNCDPWLA